METLEEGRMSASGLWLIGGLAMKIRFETSGDIKAIHALTAAAFKDAEHSSGTEAAIVDALREAKALTVSLVALDKGEIAGHVAFSPVTIGGLELGWYGLGPVSVHPGHQRKGIGQALIREGLEHLGSIGAKGCVVLGDPGYYARFGFSSTPVVYLEGVPAEYFQALAFSGAIPPGQVRYHDAFAAS